MRLRVGDQFPWNNRGSILKVVGFTNKKVHFEVIGKVLITGSMCAREFKLRFLMKGERLAA